MGFVRDFAEDQRELDALRAGIDCATVLERDGFLLDKTESTTRCQKYRREDGRVVIVNHDGRGWWDPHDSVAKGDVFKLVQHLHSGMSLGHVRRMLRPMMGMAPTQLPMQRQKTKAPQRPAAELWSQRPAVQARSAVWSYLTETRGLPATVVAAAVAQDVLREGIRGTAWFAHRKHDRVLTGIEMRGPDYRGFSSGGDKTLFRFRAAGEGPVHRLVVCEAPIDALSFAALDSEPAGTVYVATAGGMGPSTLDALQVLMAELVSVPRARMVIATDADTQGDRYAVSLRDMADTACLWSGRVLPPNGAKDWNAVLAAPASTSS